MMLCSCLGGLCNGMVNVLSSMYAVNCARSWNKARILGVSNAVSIFTWALGLFVTNYLLTNVFDGSISSIILVYMSTVGIGSLLYLFLINPTPKVYDRRSDMEKYD